MNQNTRQRIIGTVVLAIVAIILLPAIFDGESSYQSSLQTNIPDRPERPIASRELPQRPSIQADSADILVRDPLDDDNTVSTDLSQRPVNAVELGDSSALDQEDMTAEAEPAPTESSTVATTESAASATPASTEDTTPDPVAAALAEVSANAANAGSDVPGLDVSGLPEAWSVRVGAFGNASNASNLTQRLSEGGHRAYTRPVSSSGRELTAVFVGPLISRQEAENVLNQVKNDYELNGMIVRYEIEEP